MSGTIPISINCPHCHKYTSLTPAEVMRDLLAMWTKSKDDTWWIGICNSCHNAVLIHDFMVKDYGSLFKTRIRNIYPHPLPIPTDDRIPQNIRKDLDEAKLCLSVNAYRGCAVMARRAIQSACIDKGADKNKRLETQIDELVPKVITPDIQAWAHSVRWVGNDAAHPESDEVTPDDAEDVLKLSEQFLHILYVAPAIALEQAKKRGKK